MSATEFLGLRRVGARRTLEALLAVTALNFALEIAWHAINRDVLSPDMVESYRSTDWIPAIWIGVAIAAPVIEEITFRGLLFSGLRRTRLGFWGTALFTSAIWASMHIQYELPEISAIFVTGVVLAGIRQRSGSVIPCIVAHVLSNAFAIGQTAHYLRSP
jgi:membrane protease YdiL (CAAX protease family)